MKKILVFLAEGFEEIEALTVVDYLRRMEVQVDTVSITDDKAVSGSHQITVLADKLLSQIKDPQAYDGLVLPGGMPGAGNLRDHQGVIDLVTDLHAAGKLVAAICAAPIVLSRAGILSGRKVTSYPGFEDQLTGALYQAAPTVTDGNIITGRGPFYAVDFSLALADYLLGPEKMQELRTNILADENL